MMAEALGLESLDRAVHGAVLRPGEDGYERARRVFNTMIDRRPSAIVRCADAADVVAAVNCARVNGLPLSVKGGGHSVAGTAVCDGGVMVDLSPMKGVRVDPDRRVALAEPGLTLGEFDSATQSFGLATTTGVVSMTGIAGLTLGGGIGWLNGRYGLACDNLIAADVVTADGRLLTASETEHEELFWALRGGGGNFGVVTSFIYRVHPVAAVLGGGVTYPPLQARDALRFYHEFASNSPDELSTAASVTMEPFLERAVYANNLGQEGTDRVRAAYGPNYDRLARVKAEYDPANLFRLNHNVTPAGRRNGRDDTPVMFVRAVDDPEVIRLAWERLESQFRTLRGRRFFGAFDTATSEYRACVQIQDEDDPAAFGLESATLPGGTYLRTRLRGEPPAVYNRLARPSPRWSRLPSRMRRARVSSSTAAAMRSTSSFQ